jgi:glycosyltransferase involved in cell wall biosynthesis
MTAGVLFIENYVAGGSDQVARLLLQKLPFSSLTVMVNQNNDMAILLSGALPPHVTVERYNLLTIPELLNFAKSKTVGPLRTFYWLIAHLLRYPLFIFSIFYFFIRIVRTKATVFVANNGGYPGGDYCRSATIAASCVPAMKVFHIVHSMAAPSQKLTSFIEWVIDRTIDCRCRLITVCQAAADQLKAKRWIKQDAEVIYNGLEPESVVTYPAQRVEFNILNVGYFDHNKNQAMLILALRQLVEKGHKNARVHFLGAETGDGLRELCRQQACELGLAEYVDFEGFVNDPQPWFQTCDLFVLCSDCEGLPMTIIEAMRSGKPVVATAVGGVPELVVEGLNGFIVQPGDHLNLAIRIESLLLDRSLATNFGSAGKARFEANFTVNKMLSEYVRVLALAGNEFCECG